MKNPTMRLEQADRIKEVWGTYLEFTHGILLAFFGATLPENLLPYPKSVIERAIKLLEQHYISINNSEAAKTIASTLPYLNLYVPNDEALDAIEKRFQNKNLVATLKNVSMNNNKEKDKDEPVEGEVADEDKEDQK